MKNIDLLIEKIASICKKNKISLVTVESCTGGGLSYYIAKNSLSSEILERGYIVYSSIAKTDMLGIPSYDLQVNGTVSKEIAISMAEHALIKSKSQISIAITGTDEASSMNNLKNKKPGMVWMACAGIDKKTISKKFIIRGQRKIFCEGCIYDGLKFLLKFIST